MKRPSPYNPRSRAYVDLLRAARPLQDGLMHETVIDNRKDYERRAVDLDSQIADYLGSEWTIADIIALRKGKDTWAVHRLLLDEYQGAVTACSARVQQAVLRVPGIIHGGERTVTVDDESPTRGGCAMMVTGALATVAVVVGAVLMAHGWRL